MINLFILTLIEQFEESNQNSDNPLYAFNENLSKFRKVWSTISKDRLGLVIHKRDLVRFFKLLRPPLGKFSFINDFIIKINKIGFSRNEEYDNIFKEIMLMKIPM